MRVHANASSVSSASWQQYLQQIKDTAPKRGLDRSGASSFFASISTGASSPKGASADGASFGDVFAQAQGAHAGASTTTSSESSATAAATTPNSGLLDALTNCLTTALQAGAYSPTTAHTLGTNTGATT